MLFYRLRKVAANHSVVRQNRRIGAGFVSRSARYCFIRPVCPGYTAYSPHSKPPSVGITLSICSKLSLVRPIPACSGWLYQTQRWAAALDSIALKCISCKILPCRARVIFRKKRWKSLIRQPYTASVNPKRFGRKKNRKKGK
ncbi:hypothetical protein [Bacteroides caecimuris]|uniref:hypothetical protein n=1 Tax=Bacteroides caecimuris TaxID=1796613 RepID=UPI0026597D49|nr:hypothetical protein [Bacteroides caecimuris]